ncbi:MAG: DUF2782 domain-containing protein [Rhodocyclales bacterium GT-UBC]|nr:MAG: DUF2782 domain-containing protein [Rhodocyclales bacterium GT-UBC]
MRRFLPILLLLSSSAWAQSGELQPLPAVPPPPPGMEAFDAAMEPQVTIVKSEKETREEYRIKGKLYMIKVTPAVGPAFYLVDRQGDGNFIEADIPHTPVKPPMWIIHSW